MMYPNYNNKQEKDYGCFFILIVIAAVCFFIWLIWDIVSSPETPEQNPDSDSLATELTEDSIKADTICTDIYDVVESDGADEDKKSVKTSKDDSSSRIKRIPDLGPISEINSELMKDIERTISRGKKLESQAKSLRREQSYDVKHSNINIRNQNVNIDNTTETVTSEPASVPEETPVTE